MCYLILQVCRTLERLSFYTPVNKIILLCYQTIRTSGSISVIRIEKTKKFLYGFSRICGVD